MNQLKSLLKKLIGDRLEPRTKGLSLEAPQPLMWGTDEPLGTTDPAAFIKESLEELNQGHIELADDDGTLYTFFHTKEGWKVGTKLANEVEPWNEVIK